MNEPNLRWLTNIHLDPQMICRCSGESQQEAIENHREFLRDKIIGDPKATATYTVEALKKQGMVGVYALWPISWTCRVIAMCRYTAVAQGVISL